MKQSYNEEALHKANLIIIIQITLLQRFKSAVELVLNPPRTALFYSLPLQNNSDKYRRPQANPHS